MSYLSLKKYLYESKLLKGVEVSVSISIGFFFWSFFCTGSQELSS